MNISKCKRCGSLFQKMTSRTICQQCVRQEELDFIKVKERIQDFPGENINQLAENTGVDRHLIVQFMRSGRLQMDQSKIPEELFSPCQRCGQPTTSNRFCEKCLKQVSKSLIGNEPPPRQKSPARKSGSEFHFRDHLRKGGSG